MKKVKYVGGLGETAQIVFAGSRSYNFNEGQVLVIDDEAGKQLLDTAYFVEVDGHGVAVEVVEEKELVEDAVEIKNKGDK